MRARIMSLKALQQLATGEIRLSLGPAPNLGPGALKRVFA